MINSENNIIKRKITEKKRQQCRGNEERTWRNKVKPRYLLINKDDCKIKRAVIVITK
jgi:hypothetical protein